MLDWLSTWTAYPYRIPWHCLVCIRDPTMIALKINITFHHFENGSDFESCQILFRVLRYVAGWKLQRATAVQLQSTQNTIRFRLGRITGPPAVPLPEIVDLFVNMINMKWNQKTHPNRNPESMQHRINIFLKQNTSKHIITKYISSTSTFTYHHDINQTYAIINHNSTHFLNRFGCFLLTHLGHAVLIWVAGVPCATHHGHPKDGKEHKAGLLKSP